MKILKHNDIKLKSFLKRSKVLNDDSIYKKVKEIIFNVKKNGDKALIKYAKQYDKIDIDKKEFKLNLRSQKINSKLDKEILNSFKTAIKNITKFHKKQLPINIDQSENNINLQSVWKSIDSVGLYVPGGNAFYPSSFESAAIFTLDGVGEWTTTSLALGKGNNIKVIKI